MNELTPHQKAALNYKEHISLTANAGAGKTLVLSNRYVEIALNEDVSLRNLAAITFTEKAAAELYGKISEKIDERITSETNNDKRKKLERLRRQLVSANISTIHSFCIDILKEFPAEAQIDANFTPIDTTLSNELIQLSVEEVLKTGLKDEGKSKELKSIIRIFASKNKFEGELTSLLEKRKHFLKIADNLNSKTEEEIASWFFTEFKEFVTPLIQESKSEIIKLIEYVNEGVILQNKDNETANNIKELISEIKNSDDIENNLLTLNKITSSLLTTTGSIKSRGYLSKNREEYLNEIEKLQNYFAEIKDLCITEDHAEDELELAKFGKIFSKYFLETLALYEEKKRQNGYLDFEDILICTKRILEKDEVKSALGEKYKYIMVDEYQDTNEIQYEIFMPILEYLKKGNLFIVGDEKQSIYMFRDAELEIFDRTKKEILAVTSKDNLLILPHNFRMAPNLCLFTNHVCSGLFTKPNILFNEVGYNELICTKDEEEGGNVEIILSDSEDSVSEAELVAKRLINLTKDGKCKLGDVAILCRRRKSFEALEKEFCKYNIPYSILGGRGFYQQQIIYDIYNYLAFLLNKEDDAALIGILRSPFFLVSDVEIYEISLLEGSNYWKKLCKYAESSEEFLRIKKILDEKRKLAFAVDIPNLLRKILSDTAFLTVVSSHPDSRQELANIEKIISIAQDFTKQGFRTLFDFVNFLAEAIESFVDEGDAVAIEEEDAVKIMTLHQAKGAEYPVVVLYNSGDKSHTNSVKAKTVHIDKKFGVLTNLPAKNNYFEQYRQAPVVSLYNYIQKKKNLAELKRLLYVGLTRAKKHLIISASHKENEFGKDSFMSMILSTLKFDSASDEIIIKDDLQFLNNSGQGQSEITKNMVLNIPVIRKIDNVKPRDKVGNGDKEKDDKKPEGEKPDEITKVFQVGEIKDLEKEEIISATKIAVYNQCPVKYQLTYEFGYSELFGNYKKSLTEFDFSDKENEYNLNSALKGRVIHKILEKEYPPDELNDKAEELIKIELDLNPDKKQVLSIKEAVIDTIRKYYSSETYREIKDMGDHHNEAEIYVKENDYFLYGIIDKLIIDNDEATIIDYKTDDIEPEELSDRFKQYSIQLKFYSYIVNRLYPQVNKFNIRIVFIKHPDKKMADTFNKSDVINFGEEIGNVVDQIRNKRFEKKLSHCVKCNYSLNNNRCVKYENGND